MNPKIENLRVAVVPSEIKGTYISQCSSVEEILACKETILYSVPDYFKAQNDEEFGVHWSFLIDIEKKEDLTGCNLEGVDMPYKEEEDNRVVILMTDDNKGYWSIYNEAGQCLEPDIESYEEAKQYADDMGWEEVDTFNI